MNANEINMLLNDLMMRYNLLLLLFLKHTFPLSLKHTLSLSLSHSYTLSLTLTHIPLFLSLSHTRTHTPCISLTQGLSHTHAHALKSFAPSRFFAAWALVTETVE